MATFGGGKAEVQVFMSDVITRVAASATLREAARLLHEGSVGALVVGDEPAVDGVMSERDVVRAVATGADLDATTVGEVATRDVVWCRPTATVHVASELMMEAYVRHVLVERDGELVGIVSARDLLGAYAM